MKPLVLAAMLLCSMSVLAADQPSLVELDRAIVRPPPYPPPWETNFASLAAEAETGDANAQMDVGLHYLYAIGAKRSLTNAVQWVRKSADQSFAPAEYTLGIFYKYGLGVSSNQTAADEWFQKAADQDFTPAKHEAAVTADRNGNRAEALKLLREAAEKGFPSSEYLMGCLSTNLEESYVWHSLAAPSVELASTRQLELQQQLTKEQLAQAEERIRKFKEHLTVAH